MTSFNELLDIIYKVIQAKQLPAAELDLQVSYLVNVYTNEEDKRLNPKTTTT